MEQNFSFKELYDVALKSTYPIEVNGRKIEIGEKIVVFDRIQISNFNERKSFTSANGGQGNQALIWWEEEKPADFALTQGVFSKEQFSFLTGARLIRNSDKPVIIDRREIVETDENGKIELKNVPNSQLFIYNKENGEKITDYQIEDKTLTLKNAYQEVIVDYTYDYNKNSQIFTFGNELINGFLQLEGKTRVKDDTTGQVKTGIIKIPKLKLMSTLSIRLGENSIPVSGTLRAAAVPTGSKGSKRVMELYILDDDIDSDM